MIDLRGSRFTDIMPQNLAGQIETQAFAYALGRQIERLCAYANGVRIYASIASIPENILDILAVELRTPAYSQSLAIEAKRALVAGTLKFYSHLGTPAAVEEIIQSIFKRGKVSEWFEYGGEPHHFRVDIILQGEAVGPGTSTELRRLIHGIKRLSSWLDEIRFVLEMEKAWATAGGGFVGSRTENRVAVSMPPLERPGGRGLVRACGAMGGMYQRMDAVLAAPTLARPQGAARTAAGAALCGSCQRMRVAVRVRGAAADAYSKNRIKI